MPVFPFTCNELRAQADEIGRNAASQPSEAKVKRALDRADKLRQAAENRECH